MCIFLYPIPSVEFDETTPVVVADFSSDVGGEIFGVSKVKCVHVVVLLYLWLRHVQGRKQVYHELC